MVSSAIVDSLLCSSISPSLCSSIKRHQILSSTSFFKREFLPLKPIPISPRNSFRSTLVVSASAQFNFLKVVQTVWKVGKDGIEAGTNLVPDFVPRSIARISVTVLAFAVSLFVLKSFLSTALFALATMGFIYFIFIALNKDQGPRGGGGGTKSSEDPLEEARRIMEKYK